MRWKQTLAILSLSAITITGCANNSTGGSSTTEAMAAGEGITLTNCGEEKTYMATNNLMVNDGNIIAMVLAAGGRENIKWVSSLDDDADILKAKYGQDAENLESVSDNMPSLEEIVAKHPDVMVAGWNYGFTEGKNLTPDALKQHDINSYILTESCRQPGTTKRGVVDPWKAVEDDVTNFGKLTGHEDTAAAVVKDQQERLAALNAAPKPEKTPVTFVFDSAKDSIFTSGKFGGPQAIIEAAGGKNAADSIEDTWTDVGWEFLTEQNPDVFVMVDYPGQTFEEKVKILKERETTKDLPAVKENRFINLPYAMWTSSPLNIDAAEYVRKAYEKFGLAPSSDVATKLTLPESLQGREYFVE
ncbi:MAG: ABC transporter substrate-binding protein [Corynebacterium sp.]|nr:ABC transporter substrate-binding protein [Corynebacterium sp.]